MTDKTNTVATETAIADLEKLAKQKSDLVKAVKAKKKLEDWEASVKSVNPDFVLGSTRKATDADLSQIGHSHGYICKIKCQTCSKIRVINKQDARQCHYCKACKVAAKSQAQKAKRQIKKVAGKSSKDLETEIATLKAQLGAKVAKAEAEPKAKRIKRAS